MASIPSNPYAVIPAIGRIWQAIHDLAAELASPTLIISIRQLAGRAGVSPGSVPRLLRQLEADGQIAYQDGVITLAGDQSVDRQAINPLIDQSVDRPADSIPTPSTPHHPQPDRLRCMEDHESHEQQQQQHARDTFALGLMSRGVNPHDAYKIATLCPDRRLGQFDDQIAAAQFAGKRSPLGLVIYLWSRGLWFVPPKEPCDAAPVRPDGTDGTDGTARSRTGRALQSGADNRRATGRRSGLATPQVGSYEYWLAMQAAGLLNGSTA